MKEIVKKLTEQLTEKEKILLASVILNCEWGDTEAEFLDENENSYKDDTYLYDILDVKRYTSLSSRQISGTFSSMFKKLCPKQIGHYLSHYEDFWADGSGPVLAIKIELYDDFNIWAKDFLK